MPLCGDTGPHDAQICIVGEAPGEHEERIGLPFQGASGTELTRMLSAAGIARESCFITNVFPVRPQGNDIKKFFGTKKAIKSSPFPSMDGKYLKTEYESYVHELHAKLEKIKPNIIITLGRTSTWALLGPVSITSIRGYVAMWKGIKVLPTYHPAAVLRQWSYRPIVIFDLAKAERESITPDLRVVPRFIKVAEDYEDVCIIRDIILGTKAVTAFDIETAKKMITAIGFAPNDHEAYVIPLTKNRYKETAKRIEVHPYASYWGGTEATLRVIKVIKEICEGHNEKLAQNGLYDIQYLFANLDIRPCNCVHDSMLSHYALQPEMPKDLGFLGSLYTNSFAWKLLRKGSEEKVDG